MKIEYDFGSYGFDYEVDYKELNNALIKILCDETKSVQGSLYSEDGAYQMALYVVKHLDLIDSLCKNLEEELKKYFYSDALRKYEEMEDEERELDDWYGTINNVRGI